MRTVAGSIVPDEERARKLLDGFLAAAAALIIRVKKQELGIEVWLRESQTARSWRQGLEGSRSGGDLACPICDNETDQLPSHVLPLFVAAFN